MDYRLNAFNLSFIYLFKYLFTQRDLSQHYLDFMLHQIEKFAELLLQFPNLKHLSQLLIHQVASQRDCLLKLRLVDSN